MAAALRGLRHVDDVGETFQLVERLGSGTFGDVFAAVDLRLDRLVAIKVLAVEDDADMEPVFAEIDILKQCDHPHIAKYYESFVSGEEPWIIMEYCAVGSLADLMGVANVALKEDEVADVCAAVLLGLSYLHEKRPAIIHRDLKAENVLLSADGVVKLVDFGVSSVLQHTMSQRHTLTGTPHWIAPEVLMGAGHGRACDIWSLGITAIQLADGSPPFGDITQMRRVMLMILKRDPPTLQNPAQWSAPMNDFIARCLVKDPDARPDARSLLEHPFVRERVALLRENNGVSDVLARLAAEHLPAIEAARAEDADLAVETYDGEEGEADGAGAGAGAGAGGDADGEDDGGDGSGGGSGGDAGDTRIVEYADGTVIANGTLRQFRGTSVAAGPAQPGTVIQAWATVKRSAAGLGTVRIDADAGGAGGPRARPRVSDASAGGGAAAASGTVVLAAGARDSVAASGTMVASAPPVATSGPVEERAGSDTPAFLRNLRQSRASRASGESAARPSGGVGGAAAVAPPAVAGPGVYESLSAGLDGLPREELLRRKHQLNSQFREDLAALSDRLKAALGRLDAEMARRDAPIDGDSDAEDDLGDTMPTGRTWKVPGEVAIQHGAAETMWRHAMRTDLDDGVAGPHDEEDNGSDENADRDSDRDDDDDDDDDDDIDAGISDEEDEYLDELLDPNTDTPYR